MFDTANDIQYHRSSTTPVNPISGSVSINNVSTKVMGVPLDSISSTYSLTKFNIHLSSLLRVLFAQTRPLFYEGSSDDLYVSLMALDDFQGIPSVHSLKFVVDKVCHRFNVSPTDLIKLVIKYMNDNDYKDYLSEYPYFIKDKCILFLIDLFDSDDSSSSDSSNLAKVIISLTKLYESRLPNSGISTVTVNPDATVVDDSTSF